MLASVLLSLVMSWVVETKSSVSANGDVPGAAQASYACTYQKGTVRKDDSATLLLSGIGGIEVEQVEIYLKSNKTAGAGEIRVLIDDALVSQRSGTLRDWVGQYDNTEFHAVELLSGHYSVRSSLQIQVTGIVNSLYIEKFVITYKPAPTYSVELMAGNEHFTTLRETEGGEGVQLPALNDRDGVHFLGWSETEFWTVYTTPEMFFAGEHYFPQTNTTLWSVWMYVSEQDTAYVTNLKSGEYIYVNRTVSLAMAGTPDSDGRMWYAPANPGDKSQIYSISFLTPETATIRHTATGTPIGYSGKKLIEQESVWQVFHSNDTTVFYMENKGKTYVLFITLWDNIYQQSYVGLAETSNLALPLGIRHRQTATGEQAYTCHPENGQGCEPVLAPKGEYVVPFGCYEIHILDGKKQIRLRN